MLGFGRHADPLAASIAAETPARGDDMGQPIDGIPTTEGEHYMRCPACGGMIDCRDLEKVIAHNGPLPHPAEDKALMSKYLQNETGKPTEAA